MNALNNMKIGVRIYLIAIILNILVIVIAGISILKMSNIGEALYDVAEIDIPLTKLLTEINSNQLIQDIYFEKALRYANITVSDKDEERKDRYHLAKENIFKYSQKVTLLMNKAKVIPQEAIEHSASLKDKKQFKDILDSLLIIEKEKTILDNNMKKIFSLIDRSNINRAEKMAEKLENEAEELLHELEKVLMNIEKFTETSAKNAEQEEKTSLKTMIWMSVISLIIGMILSVSITRSITLPLKEIVKISGYIANGELDKKITIDQRDEIGDLANMFKKLIAKIRKVIQVTITESHDIKEGKLHARCEVKSLQNAWLDLTTGINDIVDSFMGPFEVVALNLNRLSDGDIPDVLDHEYDGEFNNIKNSLNQLIKVLSEIITEIKSGTDVLLDSVQDLTVSSQEISSTSNEQAAAVKEIVSTMEDSDQLAKSVTNKITEVTEMTSSTKTVVTDGFTVIKDSLEKMNEIKTANAETISDVKSLSDKVESIWEIVNMINGIADQTKIIAFNAELEASSAGEAGKNFQIVASEIRRLADSTVTSTSEIKSKITEIQQSSDSLIIASEEGTAKITEGWELSNNLKSIFEEVLQSAEVSAVATDQISLSINQQASAFEQILLTLKQISEGIDNFVISTRATSEASEKLKEISNKLHTVLENYVGNGEESDGQ